MNRAAIALIALLVGGAIAYLVFREEPSDPETASDLHRAFSRAYAYYVNQTSRDYRRARLELEPFADQLGGSVAYHLDMALIGLAEINQPVQDEDRIIRPPSNHQRLLESSLDHLERARAIDAGNEAVAYNLARTYIKLAPSAEDDKALLEAAERLLRPLADQERPDPAALIVLGELLDTNRDYEGAMAVCEELIALGSDFVPKTQFIVTRFRLAQFKSRLGDSTDLEQFLKQYPDRPKPKRMALEGGRYTKFLQLTEAPKVVPDPREMNWRRVTERSLLPKAGSPRFFIAPDLDGDCRRDVVMNAADGLRVLRARRSGSFSDLTEKAGIPKGFQLHAAAAGDINNDGLNDLVIGGPDGVRILQNTTDEESPLDWQFVDVTGDTLGPRGKEAAHCIVLWDFDHDGDLDIFVGGEENRVYRTIVEEPPMGGRFLRFVEMAEKLGMLAGPVHDALMIDVDDDDDVDLVVSGAWFENLRQLTFKRHPFAGTNGFAAADIDNDLHEEVIASGIVFMWARGDLGHDVLGPVGERDALLDLDGDGVIDEKPFSGIDLPGKLIIRAVGTDLNRDGGRDLLVMTDAGLDLFMSRPKRPMGWIDFMPRGLKTNEFGIGARLHLFAGDLRIGATCRDGLVSFGLGKRTVVDAVLFKWTNGVAQGVVLPGLTKCVQIDEREGESTSCPFLYAFDGTAWHFINDCQSGTPLGLPYKDGAYLPARDSETILVPGDKLKVIDGRLRLDLAEEFHELFYVDQVVLRALDHPPGVRPVLDEGFRVFTHQKFRVYGLNDLRPPRAAKDHKGRDILELVSKRDKRHAVVWDKLDSRFVGLAKKWSIELDFGDLSKAARVLLVMDGWVEFPTASASIAASQTKTVQFMPPVIELIGEDGKWFVAEKDPGFPAGKGKAVLVNLTGKFKSSDGRIRITGTQRLHWDAFSVSTAPGDAFMPTVLEVPLLSAEHGFRGVGKRVERPGQPWTYSHDDLETFYRWDQMPRGMLTRYGDVKQLLATIDDRYPVMASGDVIHLVFDASSLPPVRAGWVRDYCFTTQGWVKDADPNQAVRERVTPLPFRAMGQYPYDEAEKSHPHPDWVKEWFTRPTRRLVNPQALVK